LTTDPKQPIADPNCVPVLYVTGVFSNIFNGQTIAMNLITDRLAMYLDGSGGNDIIVAARLRFDLVTARIIRDQLDAHLSGLTKAPVSDTKPN
jgi:hypothetical protein